MSRQIEFEVWANDVDWLELASCRGMDPTLFFPERGDNHAIDEAKRICKGCPVTGICLETALENGEKFGVFGGTSERERRRLRRSRRQSAYSRYPQVAS